MFFFTICLQRTEKPSTTGNNRLQVLLKAHQAGWSGIGIRHHRRFIPVIGDVCLKKACVLQ